MDGQLTHDRRVQYRADTRRAILDAAEALLEDRAAPDLTVTAQPWSCSHPIRAPGKSMQPPRGDESADRVDAGRVAFDALAKNAHLAAAPIVVDGRHWGGLRLAYKF